MGGLADGREFAFFLNLPQGAVIPLGYPLQRLQRALFTAAFQHPAVENSREGQEHSGQDDQSDDQRDIFRRHSENRIHLFLPRTSLWLQVRLAGQ